MKAYRTAEWRYTLILICPANLQILNILVIYETKSKNNTDNFFQQLSNEGTLDCLSKIFAKYDKHQELINNIKNDEKEELMKQSIPDLFNFTRDVLTANNTRQVEHDEIHKVANMLLHFAVEMGHNKQQNQAMMQQFNQEKEQSL